jgi:hypothetical protein
LCEVGRFALLKALSGPLLISLVQTVRHSMHQDDEITFPDKDLSGAYLVTYILINYPLVKDSGSPAHGET